MSIPCRLCFTCSLPVILFKMATGGEGQLTNNQIVHLARVISSRDMESIALGYLGIEDPVIKNIKQENRDNAEAFNREVIRHWICKNPEPNQAEVRTTFSYLRKKTIIQKYLV